MDEMYYRIEFHQERGTWHHEWLGKRYVSAENTHGWVTVVDRAESRKASKFSNFMDVYYGGELGAPKRGLSVEKIKEDWAKFCLIYDSISGTP